MSTSKILFMWKLQKLFKVSGMSGEIVECQPKRNCSDPSDPTKKAVDPLNTAPYDSLWLCTSVRF